MAAELAEAPQPAVRDRGRRGAGRSARRPPRAGVARAAEAGRRSQRGPRVRPSAPSPRWRRRCSGRRASAQGRRGKRRADAERALEARAGSGRRRRATGDRLRRRRRQGCGACSGRRRATATRASGWRRCARRRRAPPRADSRASEIVRGAVDDRSETVRAEAMRLLAGAAGGGARDVLPTFEAMLRGGDAAAREAAVAGVGELPDRGRRGHLGCSARRWSQRSESLRTAAARALGRLAGARARARSRPTSNGPCAIPPTTCAAPRCRRWRSAWSQQLDARELGRALVTSDADSTRRFVALEALVARAQRPGRAGRRARRRPRTSWIASPRPARRWPGWRRRSAAASSTRPRPSCTSSSSACFGG